MTLSDFPEANTIMGRPRDLEASQCLDARAYVGTVAAGTMDGATVVVTCWQPSEEEIKDLVLGGKVFMSSLGGLPPHFLTTKFKEAIHPA